MDEKALAGIASELYALPFDDFVAARAAAAKAAAGSGTELPAAVKTLRKPSIAAWTLNMLAVHQRAVLAELAALGDKMRQAQTGLDAVAMRELARERRTLLASAVAAARSEAERRGSSLSATTASDVEASLRALTADAGAAAAVQSGLLVRTLSADGVDAVDLDGALAVRGFFPGTRAVPPRPAGATGAEKRTAAGRPRGTAADGPRLQAVRQGPRPISPSALEKAQAASAEAESALAESGRVAEERGRELADAEAEASTLTVETRELGQKLQAAEQRLELVRRRLAALVAEAKQSARSLAKAQRSARLAQERVLRLGNTRH